MPAGCETPGGIAQAKGNAEVAICHRLPARNSVICNMIQLDGVRLRSPPSGTFVLGEQSCTEAPSVSSFEKR